MTLSLEHHAGSDSPLARLDPRWRLAALALTAVLVASLPRPEPAAVALALASLLAYVARLPRRWVAVRIVPAVAVLLLFALPLPFLLDGPGPTWSLGPLTVSAHGLRAATLLTTKGLAVVLLALVLAATAPPDVTFKAARALGVPSVLVHLGLLTYRYLFVLSSELSRLRVALRVRGFRAGATRHGYRTVGHVAGTLLVRGYERAERVGQAMRARGFDGQFRSLTVFRTTPRDVAFFVGVVGPAGALLAWGMLTS